MKANSIIEREIAKWEAEANANDNTPIAKSKATFAMSVLQDLQEAMPLKEVWVVRGETSGHIEGQPAGITEYQFSDGPPGDRTGSSDYTSLEEGLAAHSGYIIHWEG